MLTVLEQTNTFVHSLCMRVGCWCTRTKHLGGRIKLSLNALMEVSRLIPAGTAAAPDAGSIAPCASLLRANLKPHARADGRSTDDASDALLAPVPSVTAPKFSHASLPPILGHTFSSFGHFPMSHARHLSPTASTGVRTPREPTSASHPSS